jgi:hypothetical protein
MPARCTSIGSTMTRPACPTSMADQPAASCEAMAAGPAHRTAAIGIGAPEQNPSVSLDCDIRGMTMPSSQLKRAERSIQTIRDQAELPPETADALQELVDVIRAIEGRLSALECNGKARHADAMTLPNRK